MKKAKPVPKKQPMSDREFQLRIVHALCYTLIAMIVAVLLLMPFGEARADEIDIDPFVGLETGSWEVEDTSESSKGAFIGLDFDRRLQIEAAYSQIEDLDQYSFRWIGSVLQLGERMAVTLNLGYHHGTYEVAGEELTDDYGSYGLGLRWDMTNNLTLRIAHVLYSSDEFDGIDLGEKPSESTLSLIYVFE